MNLCALIWVSSRRPHLSSSGTCSLWQPPLLPVYCTTYVTTHSDRQLGQPGFSPLQANQPRSVDEGKETSRPVWEPSHVQGPVAALGATPFPVSRGSGERHRGLRNSESAAYTGKGETRKGEELPVWESRVKLQGPCAASRRLSSSPQHHPQLLERRIDCVLIFGFFQQPIMYLVRKPRHT